MRCQICDCEINKGEEVYEIFAKDRLWDICELCAIAAERLGHKILSCVTNEGE